MTECKFERKGKVKCLPNEAVVRDGPCIKRQCKISEVKDGVNTEMVLLRDFGGKLIRDYVSVMMYSKFTINSQITKDSYALFCSYCVNF